MSDVELMSGHYKVTLDTNETGRDAAIRTALYCAGIEYAERDDAVLKWWAYDLGGPGGTFAILPREPANPPDDLPIITGIWKVQDV